MLIYEVNLAVDDEIANTYAAWLREHIREMLEIDGFASAAWYEREAENGTAGRRQWTIHYHVEERGQLEGYFENQAEAMRREGQERFEGRFEADRRVLEQKKVFSHQG